MTILRPETVIVSHLLTDHADLPPTQRAVVDPALIRALRLRGADPDYIATVEAGHVESLDQWAARVLGEHTDTHGGNHA